jgi:hypothetical protein
VPELSGASSIDFSTTGGTTGFAFFFAGPLNISGARNPACNANSAKAFPDGSRQLIGSIHSMGIGEIRMLECPRRPTPNPPGFCAFIVCSTDYFGQFGVFH